VLTVGQMGKITKEVLLNLPPTLTTWEALLLRAATESNIEDMRRQGLAVEIPYDFGDDDDNQVLGISASDCSQPVRVDGSPTLAKILPKLSVDEQLWLARMVHAYGEAQVLSMWPSYEVQINFARGVSSTDDCPDTSRPLG